MCDSSWDSKSVKEGLDGDGDGVGNGHGDSDGDGDFVNNNKQRNYAGSKTGPKAATKTKGSKREREIKQNIKRTRLKLRTMATGDRDARVETPKKVGRNRRGESPTKRATICAQLGCTVAYPQDAGLPTSCGLEKRIGIVWVWVRRSIPRSSREQVKQQRKPRTAKHGSTASW
ncbi:GM10903 [Drosophila sechellia]|uniref:GM10903 n=1 Tax=Drosophila sechellia TaxID=7238 RepID=B4I4H9_DROSE|nr:GM10903 [Drosophila sechellia]